jgi:replicative DNA helicase
VTAKKSSNKPVAPPVEGESLPWDEDAEESVLSCILNDPSGILPEAQLTVPDEHFYHVGNQTIYREMKAMHKMGKPVEYKALTSWLRDRDLLDRIGGGGQLSKILSATMSGSQFNYYRLRLKDKWLLRQGITLCDSTAMEGRSFHGEDAAVWTEKLASEALQLHNAAVQQGGIHQGCDLDQAGAEMERRGKQVGIPTPFPWFNRKFGGCFPGTLILFGGSRGIGKSALTRQIAWYTAGKLKEPTEVITFEMDRVQEFRRICSLEGVDNSAWLREDGTLTEYEQQIVDRVRRAAKHIPLKIHDDVSTLEQTVSRIRMGFLKRKSRVWIVDGPQALEEDSKETRERVLSRMGKTLKTVAKENQLCIICPVHLNDDGDARGSKDLENFCDVFCRLGRNNDHKPTFLEPWQQILARNSKNRNGPEEDEGCLFRFTGKHLRFEEEGPTTMTFAKPNPFPRRKA